MASSPSYDHRRYQRELWGWLSYAFASEVFVIVSLTLFLPICLEQFARDNGYLLPEKTIPCIGTGASEWESDPEEKRCVVKLGWVWIDSASFSLYVYSASVALQALTVISMGGIADHPPHRKRLLLGFAVLGFTSAILFFFLSSSSPLWPLAGPLAMCANVGFGASVVAMNAYLPQLARMAPEVVAAHEELKTATDESSVDAVDTTAEMHDGLEAPLLHVSRPKPPETLQTAYATALSATTSRISAHGIALGYVAGIALLLLTLVPVTRLGGSTWALRLAIGCSGAWWAVFSVVAGFLLPSGGDGEADKGVDEDGEGDGWGETRTEATRVVKWNTRREIGKAWVRLGGMLRWREIKKLRNTFQYLAAWFLLFDGFTTITSTAILFGKTTLHLSAQTLILIGVLTPAAGIIGALVWPFVQRALKLSNLQVLVSLVTLASLVPVYGCLGLLRVVRDQGWGLVSAGEMIGLAVYFGAVYGAFQSYARALYAELIPPREAARWYALFSITDKSSSFLGPLLVGLIADTTGNIRYAFILLVGVLWMALPVLMSVDVVKGSEDA
ncbi:autophagy-related protein 22-like protein, partial [Amylostereum chailletii]